MISLLKKHQNWEFVLLVGGEEKILIENYLKQVNLPNIKYLGQMSDVFYYLKKSKICLLYSYYEGLPTILLEAVQHKNLIVANDGKGGFADIVQNGKNGFLVQNDVEFCKKIELLISNDKVYNEMFHSEIFYEQFSESKIIEKWQQILLLDEN